ncbi:acyl-CoA dehydrogenase family protein [Streptomyces inhibens]|uniref:acyl-CoA dehydrogenase family protein n=1 Tax=Streptomyces inhibens TaxID=2293571 RepID=UPI001EE6D1DD|nr:acyl-CoA dehydrogenase family protein [Streptomyces inhibens]UKY53213.1 acyl-CoA dehydrogenase family protein [Streptomyces inhibens]
MDFEFTDEQKALRARVRAFAAERIAPDYQENDRRGSYPPGLLKDMAEQGLFSLRIPVEYGGQGLDAVSTGIVLEELAKADQSVCYPVLNAALIAGVLAANGTKEQLARWLPPIARGESVVALCLTEPEHGTDAAGIELPARPDGAGWRLTGRKTSIMIGSYATHGLVFARTGEAGARGVTAFFTRLDEDRVSRTQLSDLGCRSAGRAELEFDDLLVTPDEVVGGPGLGFVQVMRGFDYSRALIALMAVGAAGTSMDKAFAHARERVAFGQPIGTYQGVAFPLVEHATYLHGARLLAYEALWRNDVGKDHRVEANMAKWWAPRAAMEAAHQALLTLGHFGWSEDQPVAHRLRDVIGLQLADGTENATKLVVARQLLGREYAP